MKLIQRNKRGFTLVEMMLALAIIVIIGWTTVALMFAIRDSFMTTYNTNDSSDYAVLYANGLENAFLRNTQDKAVKSEVKFKINRSNSYLMENSSSVFVPNQMKTKSVKPPHNVVDKWTVRMYFSLDPNKGASVINYKVFLIDNYYSPDARVMCVHEDSVWAPHLAAKKITFENEASSDTIDTTLRHDYGLDSSTWFDILVFKGN